MCRKTPVTAAEARRASKLLINRYTTLRRAFDEGPQTMSRNQLATFVLLARDAAYRLTDEKDARTKFDFLRDAAGAEATLGGKIVDLLEEGLIIEHFVEPDLDVGAALDVLMLRDRSKKSKKKKASR
jgi:hypothetical protein